MTKTAFFLSPLLQLKQNPYVSTYVGTYLGDALTDGQDAP